MSAWSNEVGKFCIVVAFAVLVALLGAPMSLSAQEQQQGQQQPQQRPLSQQELQQLVAPIALYPDPLLAQVLTASTYPLEVAMAAHWSEKNPNLKGAALENAMQKQPWDPSVKGLTSVPQVLAMMNDKLDWTSQLGEAFLAQPDDVQNAIQALRARAEAAGNLKSSKEQTVRKVAAMASSCNVGPPEYIEIEPVEPDYVYVPVYDPVIVYGINYWPAAYVPFFWYPPWWTVGPAFGFGPAFLVGPALWYHYNWGYGGFAAIQVNTTLYSKFNKAPISGGGQFQNWKFDPAHHGNVPFKNAKLQQQFGNLTGTSVQGIHTGTGVQGVHIGTAIQGTQTGKGIQGIHKTSIQGIHGIPGGSKNKTSTGSITSKGIQGIHNTSIQGVHGIPGGRKNKTSTGSITSKGIQGIHNTSIQGIHNTSIQGIHAGTSIQGGHSSGKGMSASAIQGGRTGGKGNGKKKDGPH